MRVFMITSEWPTPEHPEWAPFVVRQVEYLRRTGIDVDVFHFRGAGKPGNYLQAWQRVQTKLQRASYDLVHCQWGQSVLPALPKRLPLVVTFRGSDLEGFTNSQGQYTLAGRLLRLVGQVAARQADQVIIVSESLAKYLPRPAYTVVPSGLDMVLFRPMPKPQVRRQLGLPLNKKLVLFVGNPNNTIKRYGLAEATVAQLNGTGNVALIPVYKMPHSEIPLYMNAGDALLLTSSHEGSPNVVKEALACNLPVVSVDVGDVRQRIGKVEGCVVCENDRPETIATGLAQVLKRKGPIEGRSAVRDLDENISTQKVIEVYRKALGKNVL